jgi:hypothetical protein
VCLIAAALDGGFAGGGGCANFKRARQADSGCAFHCFGETRSLFRWKLRDLILPVDDLQPSDVDFFL